MTSFTLNDGDEYEPSAEQIANLKRAYPAADVELQLAAIKLWCDANPKQRKTRRGAQAFMNAWFARVQNDSGRYGKPAETRQRVETSPQEYRHQAAGVEVMRAVLADEVVVPSGGDYEINLTKLAVEIRRRQEALRGERWLTDRSVRSACFGTMYVAICDYFKTGKVSA